MSMIIENGTLKAYRGRDALVRIPEGVRTIERGVLCGLRAAEQILLPESLEYIDEDNFTDCPHLRLQLDGGAYYLGSERNPYLALVSSVEDAVACDVREGCRLIVGRAFCERTSLRRVHIPRGVRSIGYMAFYGCDSLKELTLSEGLFRIDACAFDNSALTRVALPHGLTYVGSCAFSCVTLREVTLADTLTYIGRDAFTRNTLSFTEDAEGFYLGSDATPYLCFMRPKDADTTHLRVHDGCRFIYTGACLHLAALEEVCLPEGLLQIGQDAFRACPRLRRVRIPESVTLIDACAFASCEALREVTLPCGALTVEEGAFMGCTALCEITLPQATVESYAFSDCTALQAVRVGEGSRLPGDGIFSDCTALETLTVPLSLQGQLDGTLPEDVVDVRIRYV